MSRLKFQYRLFTFIFAVFSMAFRIDAFAVEFSVLSTIRGIPLVSLQDSNGVLYGTTYSDFSSNGSVYKINNDGTGFTVLHSFSGSIDGVSPGDGLIQGSDGFLYGVMQSGGRGGKGTVFKVKTDGTGFAVLHHFSGGDFDGARPAGTLVLPG